MARLVFLSSYCQWHMFEYKSSCTFNHSEIVLNQCILTAKKQADVCLTQIFRDWNITYTYMKYIVKLLFKFNSLRGDRSYT